MKKILKKLGNLTMAFMLLFINLSVIANADELAELKDLSVAITQSGNIIGESDIIDSSLPISLEFNFNVPVLGDDPVPAHYFEAGDETSFNVSSGFIVTSGMGNFVLESGGLIIGYLYLENTLDGDGNETGNIVANVVFDDYVGTGTVENPEIDAHPEIFNGDFYSIDVVFNTTLEYDDSGDDGSVGDHEVTLLNKTYTVNVAPEPILFSGNKSASVSGNLIDWTVLVNATQGGDYISLENYVFEDDISNAGSYVADSFRVGNNADTTLNTAYAPTIADGLMTYDLSSYTSVSPTYISYQTEVSDEEFFSSDDLTYTNIAKIIEGEEELFISNEASVTLTKNWISKSGEIEAYDYSTTPPSASFIYTIEANDLGANLDGVVITDDFDKEHLSITEASLYLYDGDSYPAIADRTWTTVEELAVANTGVFDIGSISNKIKLIIKTDVIWSTEYDFGHNIYNIDNSASISWTGTNGNDGVYPGSGSVGPIGIRFGTNPISKSVITADKKEHTVKWSVEVKQSNVNDNLRVFDLLAYGSTFDINDVASVELDSNYTDGTGNADPALTTLTEFDMTDVSTFSSILNGDVQFNQKYYHDDTNADNNNLTVYNLKDSGGNVIADLIIITESGNGIDVSTENKFFQFYSQVTDPNIYASNNSVNVYNRATLFSGDTELNSSRRRYNYSSDMLKKDMLTRIAAEDIPNNVDSSSSGISGAFNYIDKTVVFRLNINGNNLDSTDHDTMLEDIQLTDTLPDGWEFIDIVDGSKYQVYDNSDNSLVDSTTFMSADFSESGKVIFSINELINNYVIFVKAQLDNETAYEYLDDNNTDSVTNNASLVSKDVTVTVSDSQNISIDSKIIDKNYSDSTDGELLWTIEYKPYELEYIGVEITDVLPEGLDVRTNSIGELDLTSDNFSITELTLNADGSYSDSSAVSDLNSYIEYSNNERELKFIIPESEKAYRFTYITDITADAGVTLTNSVSLSNGAAVPQGALASYSVASSDVSATMSRSGSVKVSKLNESSEALSGAVFGIYSADGLVLLRSGTTNDSGELFLRGLRAGNYILKEIEAPTGYNLDPREFSVIVTSTDGVVTTSIDGATGDSANEITLVNIGEGSSGNLKITKTLSGEFANTDKEFNFVLEISGLNGEYNYIAEGGKSSGSVEFVDGIANFSLKNNESITIYFLPEGNDYIITETDYSSEGYTYEAINATGTIVADSLVNVSFENTFSIESITGNLTINKKVSGNDTESSREFEFSVEIEDLEGIYTYVGSGGKEDGTIEFTDGVADFTLKANESLTIMYIPMDKEYTVSEEDYGSIGYSTFSLNAEGTISAATTTEVTFTNRRHKIIYPDTNENFPMNTYIVIAVISLVLLSVLLFIRRKMTVK